MRDLGALVGGIFVIGLDFGRLLTASQVVLIGPPVALSVAGAVMLSLTLRVRREPDWGHRRASIQVRGPLVRLQWGLEPSAAAEAGRPRDIVWGGLALGFAVQSVSAQGWCVGVRFYFFAAEFSVPKGLVITTVVAVAALAVYEAGANEWKRSGSRHMIVALERRLGLCQRSPLVTGTNADALERLEVSLTRDWFTSAGPRLEGLVKRLLTQQIRCAPVSTAVRDPEFIGACVHRAKAWRQREALATDRIDALRVTLLGARAPGTPVPTSDTMSGAILDEVLARATEKACFEDVADQFEEAVLECSIQPMNARVLAVVDAVRERFELASLAPVEARNSVTEAA
jgi:hypothetical protein